MKDFEDFVATITPDIRIEVENTAISKVHELRNTVTLKNSTEKMLWHERAISTAQTIEYLRRYHNWLND